MRDNIAYTILVDDSTNYKARIFRNSDTGYAEVTETGLPVSLTVVGTQPAQLATGYYAGLQHGDIVLITALDNTLNVEVPKTSYVYDASLPLGALSSTLTIETSPGVPVGSGIKVWLNTVNNREFKVSDYMYTDGAGKVNISVPAGDYYVFCEGSGYTFAPMVAPIELGTEDTSVVLATPIETETGIPSCFLSRMIRDIRESIDEPVINAKYTDDRLIDMIGKHYPIVINEHNRNKQEGLAIAKFLVQPTAGVWVYPLPPLVGEVISIYSEDSTGYKHFHDSRSNMSPRGRNVWLEGSTLRVQRPENYIGNPITIEYLPSGTAALHSGICVVGEEGKSITLSASPAIGKLDTNLYAYQGSMLRILKANTNSYVQTRTITNYDATTRLATLDTALDPIPDGDVYYEIMPPIHAGLDSVVARYTALQIALIEGEDKRATGIQIAYKDLIRNLRLTAAYSKHQGANRVPLDSYKYSRRHKRRM